MVVDEIVRGFSLTGWPPRERERERERERKRERERESIIRNYA